MASGVSKLIHSARHLASLPQIYHRINSAVEDPTASLDDIGAIIMEDQGLSAQLLKIANSSLYGFPQPVETISRALTVVGTGQLRDMVTAMAVMKVFKGVSPAFVSMDSFWRHSVACGLAARIIATYRRESNVESFYVSGLLHDVGRLLLYMYRPEEADRILRQTREEGALMVEMERDELEFDHADVGWALLQQWQLPQRLFVPVAWHHDPGGADTYATETAVVHMADIIALSLELGSSGETRVPPLDPEAWRRIDLPVNLLPAIVKQMESQWHDAIGLFVEN